MYRWYLGIQSKKDPAHVMNEVYKAMQALKCNWNQVNNYRVLCLWKYTAGILPKSSYSTNTNNNNYNYNAPEVSNITLSTYISIPMYYDLCCC